MSAIVSALLAALAPLAARAGLVSVQILIALARNSALKGVEAAITVGRAVVQDVEQNPPTDIPKAQAALIRIGALLAQQGLSIAKSDINLAIEMMVAEMRTQPAAK